MLTNIQCQQCVTSLKSQKSIYYYHADLSGKHTLKADDKEISKEVVGIFKESRSNYSTRNIQKELRKLLVQ